VKVDKSTAVSTQNADTLAAMAPQITEAVIQATDAATQATAAGNKADQAVQVSSQTGASVNGRMDEYQALSEKVGSLQSQLAAALARIDEAAKTARVADAALDRGIEIGRELPMPPTEPAP